MLRIAVSWLTYQLELHEELDILYNKITYTANSLDDSPMRLFSMKS